MVIDRSGEALDKEHVVIEILEDAVPGDELLQAVKEMNAQGYQFALDDFTLAPKSSSPGTASSRISITTCSLSSASPLRSMTMREGKLINDVCVPAMR